jgi:hypothetical protein
MSNLAICDIDFHGQPVVLTLTATFTALQVKVQILEYVPMQILIFVPGKRTKFYTPSIVYKSFRFIQPVYLKFILYQPWDI